MRPFQILSTVMLFGALSLDVAVGAAFVPTGWAYIAAALVVGAAFTGHLILRATRGGAGSFDVAAAHGASSCDGAVQAYAGSVARSLRALYGRSCAFVLLAAPVGESPAEVKYISNLDRADGTDLLRRLFASWQQPAASARQGSPAVGASPEHTVGTPSFFGAMWQVLEYAHDAVILWQMDGAGIVYWNQAAEALYGYSREEVRGQVTHALLKTVPSGRGIQELEEHLARYGVWVGELQHTARDGQRILVASRLSLMAQVDGKWLVLELNRDITDRANAEEASRATQEQLSALRRRLRAA